MDVIGDISNLDGFVSYVIDRAEKKAGALLKDIQTGLAIVATAATLLDVIEELGVQGLESAEFYRIRSFFDQPKEQQICKQYQYNNPKLLVGGGEIKQDEVGQVYSTFLICRFVASYHLFKVSTRLSLWWWYTLAYSVMAHAD